MNATEEWREIPGAPNYLVSNFGSVKSLNYKGTGKAQNLKQCDVNGRKIVTIKGKSRLVHRLVAEAFIPNPENKAEVNHINCRPDDNRAVNLEWLSKDENMVHYTRSEKFQKIHKAPQRFYWTKGKTTAAEYELIPRKGTSKNIATGEIVLNTVLIDSGYKLHCEFLSTWVETHENI